MSQAGKQAGAGAATGAASGAAMGSMILPGWGTAIGAGVGAIAGGIGGYMKGKGADDRNKQKRDAWNKAQETLARSRQQQLAGRGALVQQAYSPMANAMNSMYGENLDLSNPLQNQQRGQQGFQQPKMTSFSPGSFSKLKGKK